MRSIFKKIAYAILTAALTVGMFSCSNDDDGGSKPAAATPEFSVAAGKVNIGTSLEITCATEDAKIFLYNRWFCTNCTKHRIYCSNYY